MTDNTHLSMADAAFNKASSLSDKECDARVGELQQMLDTAYGEARIDDEGKTDMSLMKSAPFTGTPAENAAKVLEIQAELNGVLRSRDARNALKRNKARREREAAAEVTGENERALNVRPAIEAQPKVALGTKILEAMADGSLQRGGDKITFEGAEGRSIVNTLMTRRSDGYDPEDPRSGILVSSAIIIDSVSSILPTTLVQGDKFVWEEQDTETSGAAVKAEGTAASQGAADFVERNLPTVSIREYMSATDEQLRDAAFLEGWITARMGRRLDKRIATQVISGSGSGNPEQVQGLASYTVAAQKASGANATTRLGSRSVRSNAFYNIPAGYVSGTRGTDANTRATPDEVLQAIESIYANSGENADAVAMSGSSIVNIANAKDSQSNYLFVPPGNAPLTFFPRTGLRIIRESELGAGEYLIGAFGNDENIVLGMKPRIGVERGFNDGDFIAFRTSFRINAEIVLAVPRPRAFLLLVNSA